MARALTIGAPQHPATDAAYEQECREMLVPHLDALLDKVEAAGWDRGQAASALMYLAAMRLKPASRQAAPERPVPRDHETCW